MIHNNPDTIIQTNRLDRGFFKYQEEFESKALSVLRSGWYILGEEVSSFEKEFAAFTGAKYCVGVGNGLDALTLAFRALGIGPGDEVIVQGNTYIASVMGVTINGATPVFTEPDEFFNLDENRIEEKITEKTKAVLAVHLYGQATKMDKIVSICKKHGLKLMEDCAQSHGARFFNAAVSPSQTGGGATDTASASGTGKTTGTFGEIGCFSFYPSKNIGAFGDGGCIVTDDPKIDRTIRTLRNYGSEKRYYNEVVGVNSRLDELQAGLLRVRLSHAEELNEEKKRLAARYDEGINNDVIIKPKKREGCEHIYHQYVIRCEKRDELASYLKEKGIMTIIHYPIPPHLSKAYTYLGYEKGSLPITEHLADTVLSIPMYNGLTEEEQDRVITALNEF